MTRPRWRVYFDGAYDLNATSAEEAEDLVRENLMFGTKLPANRRPSQNRLAVRAVPEHGAKWSHVAP